MKKFISIIAAAVMIMSAGEALCCSAEYIAETSEKNASTANDETMAYTIKKGSTVTYIISMQGAKKITVHSSNVKVLKITNVTCEKDIISITLKGVSEGTASLKVYDKTKKSSEINIDLTVEAASGTSVSDIIDLHESNDVNENENYAEKILESVNSERKAKNLPPLVLDETLCAAAETRADELKTKYSHTRPNGKRCFTVLDEYGITYRAGGENIARGHKNPESVMNGWMNSELHRNNIMNPKYNKLGVGYDPETDSWVQLFTD